METTTAHRDWTIDATPDPTDRGFTARAWIQREAAEDEACGDNYTFSDLGDYLTHEEAVTRATVWAIRWLNEND